MSEQENRLEELLENLLNGDGEWDREPQNKLEAYLLLLLKPNEEKFLELGKPKNRLEVLLQALYRKKCGTTK